MAPLIAMLIQSGLGILGNAVMTKGKDVIQEKLGIDIEAALGSEEGRYNLKNLEIEHEEFLITSALEDRKIDLQEKAQDVDNTKNARDANARIQESSNASWHAKNAAYMIDYLIVCATLGLAYMIFWVGIPENNKEIAYTAFGSLVTLCGTVVNFHRGSSAGSKSASEELRRLARTGESK